MNAMGMMRKYADCNLLNGNCAECTRVINGVDCHGKQITQQEWARFTAELEQKQHMSAADESITLREARMRAGLTQNELAKLAGINISQIQKIEAGTIDPAKMMAKNLISIADVLGINPKVLIKK